MDIAYSGTGRVDQCTPLPHFVPYINPVDTLTPTRPESNKRSIVLKRTYTKYRLRLRRPTTTLNAYCIRSNQTSDECAFTFKPRQTSLCVWFWWWGEVFRGGGVAVLHGYA